MTEATGGEMVKFPVKGRELDAALIIPKADQRRPAVVVVHEIWGLDAHIRDVAARFAARGYVALAPDLYTGELRAAMTPENILAGMAFLRQAPPEMQRDPSKIGPLLAQRTPSEQEALRTLLRVMSPGQQRDFAEDLVGACRYLRTRREADPTRIGAVGFCMGGGLVALLATLDSELRAAVVFYGPNPPLESVPNIRASVLGLYGGEDHRITDTVPELEEAMRKAGRRFERHIYPGAPHAFFNDTRPQVYRPASAEDAWTRVLDFLGRELGRPST
jgi:carboxymethylenebutenolidase